MSETQEKVNMQKDSQDNSMTNDVKSEKLNSDNIENEGNIGEQPNSALNDNSKSGAYNQNNSINNNNSNNYSNAWNERNNEGYYNVNNNGYNNGYRSNGDGYNNNNRYDNDYNYYNRERYNNNQNNYQESHTSKMGLGVLFALFLGVIGLLIGICLYSEGTYERKTFVKGWLNTFFTILGIVAVLIIIVMIATSF